MAATCTCGPFDCPAESDSTVAILCTAPEKYHKITFSDNRRFVGTVYNQSSLLLKWSLLFKEGVIVISVPYHLKHEGTAWGNLPDSIDRHRRLVTLREVSQRRFPAHLPASTLLLTMFGPFVHNIDPIIFSLGGVHFWWYGLSFTLGFLNAHLFLRRNRDRVGLSLPAVYDLTLFLALGVLVGGRALVVINNEWDFYREHLLLIPSIWVGGFATHGLIFGGAAGVIIFCLTRRAPVRRILDLLAISAAIIMGFGRIGNFIDGQIFGTLTDAPWGVKFPHVEGFRHPVVLYDGLKNFLLVPILLRVRSRGVPPGRVAALFVILYAALRIPIDLLREYPISMWGLPTGQTLNLIMVFVGVIFLAANIYRSRSHKAKALLPKKIDESRVGLGWRRVALAACCLIPLVIPSDATRDIPATYADRHPGLEYSWMYPRIAEDLEKSASAASENK